MGALTGKNLSKSISKSYKNLFLYLVILYDFGSDFIGFLRLGAPYIYIMCIFSMSPISGSRWYHSDNSPCLLPKFISIPWLVCVRFI